MTKVIEKRSAELIMIVLLLIVLMSSCGTPRSCANTWGAATNCPAYR